MQSGEGGLLIISPPKPSIEGENAIAEGLPFSEHLRKVVCGVADEIESLRAVLRRKDKAAIGPRFDEIDHELSLSTVHVQTDADKAVYCALSYANNFAGYYLLQTIPRSPFPGTAKAPA